MVTRQGRSRLDVFDFESSEDDGQISEDVYTGNASNDEQPPLPFQADLSTSEHQQRVGEQSADHSLASDNTSTIPEVNNTDENDPGQHNTSNLVLLNELKKLNESVDMLQKRFETTENVVIDLQAKVTTLAAKKTKSCTVTATEEVKV